MSEFIFGGVRFNSRGEILEQKTFTENGKTLYSVLFDNGCKITYEGANNDKASIVYIPDNENEQSHYGFLGIKGLSIEGSKDYADRISVKESSIKSVDLSGDGKDDRIDFINSTSSCDDGVQITADENDLVFGSSSPELDVDFRNSKFKIMPQTFRNFKKYFKK